MNIRESYQRLNSRERILAAIVAGAILLLVNILVWSSLLGALGRTRAQLATMKATRATQKIYIKERALWEKCDKWLSEHQPLSKGPGEASTLLDGVKQIAGKHDILIENPAIGASDSTPDHQGVFASIETKSPWAPLVHFLYDVQQPESFIVFENVNLQIDSADSTMMRGKFKIARWLAPQGRK
ncbi:MAG: hypothetical protein ACR2MF_10405 [Chthoniobacterales bacterium]